VYLFIGKEDVYLFMEGGSTLRYGMHYIAPRHACHVCDAASASVSRAATVNKPYPSVHTCDDDGTVRDRE